jgi:hypothetical protein
MREREGWEEFGSITILRRMMRQEGVRGFFYSHGRPRDPSSIFIICQRSKGEDNSEISLIRLIKIFATVLMLWHADLIHWGFLDAF